MKCFEATQYGGVQGIPVLRCREGGTRLFVSPEDCFQRRAAPYAIFTPQMEEVVKLAGANGTFETGDMRMLKCDVDARNELYILPDEERNDDRALVLFHHVEQYTKSVTFRIEGDGRILLEAPFRKRNHAPEMLMIHKQYHAKELDGKSVLAELGPDASLIVECNIEEPIGYDKLTVLPRLYRVTRGNNPLKKSQEIIRVLNSGTGKLDVGSEAVLRHDGRSNWTTIEHRSE